MDILGLVDIPGWLAGIIMFVLTVCIYTRYKQTYFSRNGFKQKSTTFFLGDLPEMMKKGLGYIDVDMVKKYGKVFGSYLGNQPTLVISDPEMIKTIFVKDFSNFTERGNLVQIDSKWQSAVSVAEGNHWKYLRTTLSPSFTSGKLKRMEPLLKRCLDQFHEILDEKISEDQDFDIFKHLKGYTMDVICSTGFGIDVNSQRNPDNLFIKHSKEFLEFKGSRSLSFLVSIFFPDLKLLHKLIGPANIISKQGWEFFYSATLSAFEDRKKSGSSHVDLLQIMINANKESSHSDNAGQSMDDYKKKGLSDEEVLINSLIFMVAGYDTTASTLAWLVYDLSVNQDVQTNLREELDREIGQEEPTYDSVFKLRYLDMVVSETLRVHPPATRHGRVANNDTEVCGVKISSEVFLAFYPLALHFMEEYWDCPNEYRPDRFAPENKDKINEYAYIPFGHGPRNCVGMRLALLEVKMTVVSLLQKYIIHRSDKLKVPMPGSKVGLYKPDEPVYVRLEKRNIAA